MIDVLDVATGAVRRIDEDTIGRVVGVAGHWLVGVLNCAEVGCPTVIVDIETGEAMQLPPALNGLALTTGGGKAALAMTSATRDVRSFAIDVRWLADGQTETVLRTPADRPVYLQAGVWWEPVLPADWVEIGFDHPNWRGAFALRVTDGLVVQLPAPNIEPPPPQPVPAGPITNG